MANPFVMAVMNAFKRYHPEPAKPPKSKPKAAAPEAPPPKPPEKKDQ